MTKKAQVWSKLKTVMDPELDISIVDLGLIYSVTVTKTHINIIMTLTTPGCPMAPTIKRRISEALLPLGIKVSVELIWDPPWTIDKMSEEGKLKLGII